MPLRIVKMDLQVEAITGLPSDKRSRPGTGRPSRPELAWLDAWSSVGRSLTKVHLIGREAVKSPMRAKLVVPGFETTKLTTEFFSTQRNNDPASTLDLDGENESLNDGYTAVFADSAVSWRRSLETCWPSTRATNPVTFAAREWPSAR